MSPAGLSPIIAALVAGTGTWLLYRISRSGLSDREADNVLDQPFSNLEDRRFRSYRRRGTGSGPGWPPAAGPWPGPSESPTQPSSP